MKKYKSSITLVEAVTVVTIFAVIAAATGSILFTSSRSGSRMTDQAKVFQDITWAMDYMINEARWGVNFTVSPAPFSNEDLVTFERNLDNNNTTPNECVWYWRGFTTTTLPTVSYGNSDTLYRGLDQNCSADFTVSLQAANTSRQELSSYIVDNPEDSANPGKALPIFNYNGTNKEFSVILTAREPKTNNNQTLKAKGVALND